VVAASEHESNSDSGPVASLSHDVYCLKYELSKLFGSDRHRLEGSASASASAATLLEREFAAVRKLADDAQSSAAQAESTAREAADSAAAVTASASVAFAVSESDRWSDVRRDIRCLKYGVKKLKKTGKVDLLSRRVDDFSEGNIVSGAMQKLNGRQSIQWTEEHRSGWMRSSGSEASLGVRTSRMWSGAGGTSMPKARGPFVEDGGSGASL
jgi:hypothetical protein